ncbi:hypothetical protein PENSTE_c013G00132 [Penicillium steckii]|uniref:D-xylose 1-dehydrogenase (NADP(+), D-xylono-1,5-lactone-forming) n=1 Tax=Penicillium steckii TaxID=303698 RepID=A0A1V6T3P1_9EURO|nr:hypothetical protein PENSTE_c013G00132 [Penicillium steckii]
MASNDFPILRWGIVGTGVISSWFVTDLSLDRPDRKANHIIQAIGSSSIEKGTTFMDNNIGKNLKRPTVYGSYQELFADTNVDIVYIGTPHAFHNQNCLDAIRAGKHVLCEKPFAINARETKEVFEEAKQKGVFIMEAMWTRFFPLVQKLRELIHSEKAIGDVQRVFCDFSMPMGIASLPASSRLKNPALGAGSLLDIGIYSLTWVLLALEGEFSHDTPDVTANQRLEDGVDMATSALLLYEDGRQGIATCSTLSKTPSTFCRIEGSKVSSKWMELRPRHPLLLQSK